MTLFQWMCMGKGAGTRNCNMLPGNHYFSPKIKTFIITTYFDSFSDYMLAAQNYCVILVWDFNVPGFDCNYGLEFPKYCIRLNWKSDSFCHLFPWLNQHNYTDNGSKLLVLELDFHISLTSQSILLNMEWFNLIIFILLLSLIALCQFEKVVLSPLEDILPWIMHCCTMHCLLITVINNYNPNHRFCYFFWNIKKHKYPAWPSGKLKFYIKKLGL
jgi:hypothetical protein